MKGVCLNMENMENNKKVLNEKGKELIERIAEVTVEIAALEAELDANK